MKLVTFLSDGIDRHIGAVIDEGRAIVDFTAGEQASWSRDMLALIDGGEAALDRAKTLVENAVAVRPAEDVMLLAPLPRPRQMRDFLSFELHLRQARANRGLVRPTNMPSDPALVPVPAIWFDQPIYYKCNRFSVIGPGADIEWPSYSECLDYELEFGVVIGKSGKNISRDEAPGYIFGYCVYNDVSARDAQLDEMAGQLGPAKGKDFDTGNVLGPWLVTADEVENARALEMRAWVNGELWSAGNSATMQHSFEDMIAHVSRDETIHAGEFFGSGTVGNGCGLESGRFLSDGDRVVLEVQGLGRLENTVVRKS
jgi:2-keto-4-pentenoate hydratase/2-oxohepta-3-ene-1,7-dioic acid hydratase in catechol pathway